MGKIRTVVFDLDDTLIETGEVFREVLANLFRTVEKRLAAGGVGAEEIPDRREMLARQEEIDARLLGRSGIQPERFAESLVATYRSYLEDFGLAANGSDASVERYLWSEGLRAFTEVPALSEDALEVLDALSKKERLLYTWGLERIQRPRIEAHGLDERFDEIHCVLEKSTETLARILGERDPATVLVCGDSLKGEIAPAVALGCRAVHLERPDGWSFLRAEVARPYRRIRRLREILSLVD